MIHNKDKSQNQKLGIYKLWILYKIKNKSKSSDKQILLITEKLIDQRNGEISTRTQI